MEPVIAEADSRDQCTSVQLNECRREIAALSLHSLRVELSRRKLPTAGLRGAMEARLIAAIQQSFKSRKCTLDGDTSSPHQQQRAILSVPKRFPEEPSLLARLVELKRLREGAETSQMMGPATDKKDNGGGGFAADAHAKPAQQYSGILMGRSVWVVGQQQINSFWDFAGPCGKGNLSRSAPSYDRQQNVPPSALKGRAMRQLLAMEDDEDISAVEEDRTNVEHLQFSLVEAYYASFVDKYLVIEDREGAQIVDPAEAWTLFSHNCPHFAMKFVAYSRYRTTGWLPRSGTKYGVDWVLYPAATSKHSHAPYCIILQFDVGSAGSPIERTWIRLQNKLRLVKNVAKTLVVANIHVRNTSDLKSYESAFRAVNVKEMTIDRWLP